MSRRPSDRSERRHPKLCDSHRLRFSWITKLRFSFDFRSLKIRTAVLIRTEFVARAAVLISKILSLFRISENLGFVIVKHCRPPELMNGIHPWSLRASDRPSYRRTILFVTLSVDTLAVLIRTDLYCRAGNKDSQKSTMKRLEKKNKCDERRRESPAARSRSHLQSVHTS